jgi:hypothetical protein
MTTLGKTIQIYLPDGNPRGVRIAEITSRTVQVVLAPRAHLDLVAQRSELLNVGVYFLVGPADEESLPLVYVGEAEDCLNRLRQHNKSKDFWQVALVCVSRTQYFTKTHVKYLEWYTHQAINKAGRFRLENPTVPTCPHVSESMQADLADNFETLRILVSTLGYPLFDEIQKPEKKDLLYCTGKDAEATGEYTEDGFVVFEGSTANVEEAKSAKGTWVSHIREALVQSGSLVEQGRVYRFAKNHIFTSPSAAAVAVLARNANGWTEWKYADGRTLDEVRRKDGGG